MARPVCVNIRDLTPSFTPLEIMPRCSAEGLGFIIIPAGFNAPLGFESQRLEFLTGFTTMWSSHVALERNNDAGT